MSMPLTLALVWLVVANVIAIFPSRNNHWPAAWFLMVLGLPLLVWVFLSHGFWIAALILMAAMSVLRWPVYYAWRWLWPGRTNGG
ncbi:MAG: DUF2484 family protein [Rhodobacteraceae bacterium]|nr:DUF2484 family protein [Paracoccaceae bacterium]